jgi:hypothetical protein
MYLEGTDFTQKWFAIMWLDGVNSNKSESRKTILGFILHYVFMCSCHCCD